MRRSSVQSLLHLLVFPAMGNTAPMRLFHPLNSSVVARNLWLILFSQSWWFSNLVKPTSKMFSNSKDSKYGLICYVASVVAELWEFLWFFTK